MDTYYRVIHQKPEARSRESSAGGTARRRWLISTNSTTRSCDYPSAGGSFPEFRTLALRWKLPERLSSILFAAIYIFVPMLLPLHPRRVARFRWITLTAATSEVKRRRKQLYRVRMGVKSAIDLLLHEKTRGAVSILQIAWLSSTEELGRTWLLREFDKNFKDHICERRRRSCCPLNASLVFSICLFQSFRNSDFLITLTLTWTIW